MYIGCSVSRPLGADVLVDDLENLAIELRHQQMLLLAFSQPLLVLGAELIRRVEVEQIDVGRADVAIPIGDAATRDDDQALRDRSAGKSSTQFRNGIQYSSSKPTSLSHGPTMMGRSLRAIFCSVRGIATISSVGVLPSAVCVTTRGTM